MGESEDVGGCLGVGEDLTAGVWVQTVALSRVPVNFSICLVGDEARTERKARRQQGMKEDEDLGTGATYFGHEPAWATHMSP